MVDITVSGSEGIMSINGVYMAFVAGFAECPWYRACLTLNPLYSGVQL